MHEVWDEDVLKLTRWWLNPCFFGSSWYFQYDREHLRLTKLHGEQQVLAVPFNKIRLGFGEQVQELPGDFETDGHVGKKKF